MASILTKWLTKKLSRPDIVRFCKQEETKDDNKVLIVHSADMPCDYFFPNRKKANVASAPGIDYVAEKYYEHIPVPDNSFDTIVCTGLLEHVPQPLVTLKEFNRILAPGGKLLVSASFAFSNHNAPDNYFHFTTDGLGLLFEEAGLKVGYVEPSCHPFRTIAILLQRICFQTEMSLFGKIFLKIPLFLVAKVIPFFDTFIKEDHGDIRKNQPVKSSLYSNTQGVAYKVA